MRRKGPPSELRRLAAPLARVLDGAWHRMHWWVISIAIAYALSGITVVRSDEVAVILRWGRLVGDTPALQQHDPGLLFALPRPIDQVIRVQTKRVSEVVVTTLAARPADEDEPGSYKDTLDPLTEGYALTGDENIVHATMIARYRIREPGEWAFYGPESGNILRTEVTAAMVRSLGEMGVDRVLSDGREDLVALATKRAQAGLDAAHAGLELTSLELTNLAPPQGVVYDFSRVQSEYIAAETNQQNARAYAEGAAPGATAQVDASLQSARAATEGDLARARGEAGAFKALAREYRASPAVVRERLYRDALDAVLGTALVRWLPPPAGPSYRGVRVRIGMAQPTAPAGNPTPEMLDDDEFIR